LVGTSAWISSMMTVSTVVSRARAFDVSSRKSDSGVVMRMSADSRRNLARSPGGVSPVRIAMSGIVTGTPMRLAALAMPVSGARRFRSTSTASALSGEMYSTRHRSLRGGAGSNIRRFRHQRNAASVFPLPVGARMSVDSPRAIAGHPSCWGLVGPGKDEPNHSRTAG
jgi:hypothetical protein